MKFLAFLLSVSILVVGCQSGGEAGGDTSNSTAGSTGGKTPGAPGDAPPATAVSFADANAIIQAKCAGCHGEGGKEGIDVRTYESLLKGGDHGPIIVAGKAAESMLVKSLRGTDGVKQMPFQQPPLSPEEIAKIEEWINAGAKS